MADRAVILGAGITGVLVGRALRAQGWDVVVLDALHPGAGSSSRTAAGCRQQFSTPSTVRGMRHSVAAYRALGEELGQTVLEQRGYLFLVGPEQAEGAQARVRMQQEAGLTDVRWLAAEDIGRVGPEVSEGVVGATWCPSDGFLHPQLVYEEGARLLRAQGGQVRSRSPVVGARHAGGRLVAVVTPQGEVAGDLFVDATNAWTGRTAALLGAERLPVQATTRYLWFARRGEAASAEAFGWWPMIIAPSGVYARPENPDTLLMGWARGHAVGDDDLEREQDHISAAYAHDGGVDNVAVEAWMGWAEAVPAGEALGGLVSTTAGLYAITPDHNPFLGFDRQVPNLMRLVGFSGHGAMFGPFTATVAAALARAGQDVPRVVLEEGEVDLSAFAIGRAFEQSEAMVI